MRENSIYHITPPDMKLLDTGPVVTILSSDDKFLSSVEQMHERMYKSVPVVIYHIDGPINDNNIAWLVSVMRLSDNVFVDLDSVTQTELVASLLNESSVIYFSKENRQTDILKLFNIREGYTVYGDVEEYTIMVANQYA